MRKNNDRGIYPAIMSHHSNYSQLAIGGVMLSRVHNNEEEAKVYECTPSGATGWRTRFDGGSFFSALDMPCNLVAMYVEGQIKTWGDEGAYDSEVVVEPACYAVVVFRTREEKDFQGKVTREAKLEYVYLRSDFNFGCRVCHDGVYDLKDAFETARKHGPIMTDYERALRIVPLGFVERYWHLVGKTHVPSRIRQILHRTVKEVGNVVDSNFGQGSKFFKLPRRKK
jgi:hypothetical protein